MADYAMNKANFDASFGFESLVEVLLCFACRKLIKCLLPSRGNHWTWYNSGQRGIASCLLQRYLLSVTF
jgi:hypothetical protein